MIQPQLKRSTPESLRINVRVVSGDTLAPIEFVGPHKQRPPFVLAEFCVSDRGDTRGLIPGGHQILRLFNSDGVCALVCPPDEAYPIIFPKANLLLHRVLDCDYRFLSSGWIEIKKRLNDGCEHWIPFSPWLSPDPSVDLTVRPRKIRLVSPQRIVRLSVASNNVCVFGPLF